MQILLVDNHPLFLEGMKNFLQANDINVVGTARSGPEAMTQFEMLHPDLVLMDLQMEHCDGIEATKMIKKEYPEANVVMLTAYEDEESLFAAIQAGASGYLLKGMEAEQFLLQLNSLAQGNIPFAPGLAERILKEFSRQRKLMAGNENCFSGTDKNDKEISIRQLSILNLLSKGLAYKEVADKLNLKEATIKYHVKEMLVKLSLHNRTQLISYASHKGMI